jgi:hypothetical protein
VIQDALDDEACLGQLTKFARELAPTTLVRLVARHIVDNDAEAAPHEAVVRWLQSKPQADDNGTEATRYITCDVPQRVRLFADDPNCVERATDALMLLEALEQMKLCPSTPRALVTIERPLRHTGLVEKRGEHWRAVDLFPRRNSRRNFSWSSFGKDVLQGVHRYVGKPLLSFYGLGSAADSLGEAEDDAIGRGKKNQKKEQPPSRRPPPTGAEPADATKGGQNAEETKTKDGGSDAASSVGAVAARLLAARKGGGQAQAQGGGAAGAKAPSRDGGHSDDAGARPKRGWWGRE